jgi:hypothetical protein
MLLLSSANLQDPRDQLMSQRRPPYDAFPVDLLMQRGVHYRSLLGPSFQQGWVVTNVQGEQLPEERAEGALHHIVSTEQQEKGNIFEIPSNFERFSILLAATEAD